MRKRLSLLLIVFILILGTLSQDKAHAYSHILANNMGRLVMTHWRDTRVKFYLNTQGCHDVDFATLQEIADAVAQTWSAVSSATVTVEFVGTTDAMPSAITNQADGINVLYFDNTNRVIPPNSGILGVTYVSYDNDGSIVDTDIILNDAEWNLAQRNADGTTMLQALLTHEMGHALGLDHSTLNEPPDIQPSLYPYFAGGESTLEIDDEAGISCIYPNASFDDDYGTVKGKVTAGSRGLFGANVVLTDTSSNQKVVSAFSGMETITGGEYTIKGIPPGKYRLELLPIPVSERSYSASQYRRFDFYTRQLYNDGEPLEISAGEEISDANFDTSQGGGSSPTPTPPPPEPGPGLSVTVSPTVVTLENPFSLTYTLNYPDGLSSIKLVKFVYSGTIGDAEVENADVTSAVFSLFDAEESTIGDTSAVLVFDFSTGLPKGTNGNLVFYLGTDRETAQAIVTFNIGAAIPLPPGGPSGPIIPHPK